jgi:hypothetical protein
MLVHLAKASEGPREVVLGQNADLVKRGNVGNKFFKSVAGSNPAVCTGILFEEPNPEREPPTRPNWAL